MMANFVAVAFAFAVAVAFLFLLFLLLLSERTSGASPVIFNEYSAINTQFSF